MRKLTIVLLLSTLFFSICKGEKKPKLTSQDYILTIEFYPSFIPASRIVIKKHGKKETISIDNIYGNKNISKRDGLIAENIYNSILNKDYIRYWGDTLFVKHLENQEIKKEIFQQFKNSIENIDLSKQESLIKTGILDGITIYFRYQTKNTDNQFSFICPGKSDFNEYKIVSGVISLCENSFISSASNNYIENLKGYFDFGLLVKHISDNPLEYRFYDHLSSSEADEFYKLMENLPKDKPIIFDFSNFERMGRMFFDNFRKLIDRNTNVYWIVNDQSIKQINLIGVKPERIFKDRQIVLTEIKNKP